MWYVIFTVEEHPESLETLFEYSVTAGSNAKLLPGKSTVLKNTKVVWGLLCFL